MHTCTYPHKKGVGSHMCYTHTHTHTHTRPVIQKHVLTGHSCQSRASGDGSNPSHKARSLLDQDAAATPPRSESQADLLCVRVCIAASPPISESLADLVCMCVCVCVCVCVCTAATPPINESLADLVYACVCTAATPPISESQADLCVRVYVHSSEPTKK